MTRALPATLALAAAIALLGCRSGAKYDRSTPEGTVRAFFDALANHRIPKDLESFFTDDHEVAVWKMRCKHRGCTGGAIHELTVVEKYEYRAVVSIDYEIEGNGQTRTMGGTAPVTLTREGKRWYIHQFGERRVVQTGKPEKRAGHHSPAADGGSL